MLGIFYNLRNSVSFDYLNFFSSNIIETTLDGKVIKREGVVYPIAMHAYYNNILTSNL